MLKEITSDIYRLLHPKVTFFLTSASGTGKPNVMTCAWATPVSEEPPLAVVCVSKESYTAELIMQTKEFVINIPTRELVKALWMCGKVSGRDTDKFRKAGLRHREAKKVTPPVVDGCVGYIECRLWTTLDTGECYAFFGSILSAYGDDAYFHKGLWKDESEIPLHLGGNRIVYFRN
ncbi:MAG TPA: flavin reductase family protein [Thermodesulfovibrionales bacterium]|nr:flavin reductase family protein [Thermodesulfovibrionales bacterium]